MSPVFYPKISHEIPEGHTGPARSYWDIFYGVPGEPGSKVGMVMQPPTKGEVDMRNLDVLNICGMLDAALERGRRLQQHDMRQVLGL